jgi:hypothetical protein
LQVGCGGAGQRGDRYRLGGCPVRCCLVHIKSSPDGVGLPLINGGDAFPGDYLDLEPDFDPVRSFVLTYIIADNAPGID